MRLLSATCFSAAMLAMTAASATTVRIHYDSGKQGMLVDSGKGAVSARREGKVWTYTWPDSQGDIAFKPQLGKGRSSTGGTYHIAAGATKDIYPFFGPAKGELKMIEAFASPQLKNSRKLRIYLPASYKENAAKRYPVLYMHDGQNLFDAKAAAYGVEWGIDETVDRLVKEGRMDEIIVVGIDNSPERFAEYTHCCDPKYGGGKMQAYQAFITDTVKPYIDSTLRTLPGKEHTAVMGSSLGGIASVSIAQARPDVFSMAGGVSSSFWWNEMTMLKRPAPRVPVRFYLDVGAKNDGLEHSAQMRDVMLGQGYRPGSELLYVEDPEGIHNEKSWAARVHRPLSWFFPWDSARQ